MRCLYAITVLLALLIQTGCDPAPRLLLFNHTGHDIQWSVIQGKVGPSHQIKNNGKWEGVYVPNQGRFIVNFGDTYWKYSEPMPPPREYWAPSVATRIYLMQIEPDGAIVAVRAKDLGGGMNSPATAIPEQPLGFPVKPENESYFPAK